MASQLEYLRSRLLILACIILVTSLAQSQNQSMSDLSHNQAQTILNAALEKAQQGEVLVNIAVVDAGANLKAFLRMDESFLGSIDIAIKKAKTARYFNIATGELGKLTQPGGAIYQIEHSNEGLITFPGGIPIKDKGGKVIGAVGISGGTIEQDHEIASWAVQSILN